MRTSGKAHGPCIAALFAVAPRACNAILGAGDYKVGQGEGGGSDGGEPMGSGGVSVSNGGAGHAAGGSAGKGAGGANASGGTGDDDADSGAFPDASNGGVGNGGAGAGGKAAGGTVGTGGVAGTGGKATGGTGSGGKGTGGAGTGGATGATVAAFLGTWTATSGSQTLTCRGTPTVTSLVGDTLDFEAGTTTDLEVYPSTSDCFVAADVSAKVATATKGQSCTYYSTTTGSVVAVDTYTTYTFTVGANGTTGTLQGSGNLAEVSPPMACTYTVTASFTKDGGA